MPDTHWDKISTQWLPYENLTSNHSSNIKYVVHLKPFKVEAYLYG